MEGTSGWADALLFVEPNTLKEFPVVDFPIMILIAVLDDLVNIRGQELVRDVRRLKNFFKLLFGNSPTIIPIKGLEHILQINLVV